MRRKRFKKPPKFKPPQAPKQPGFDRNAAIQRLNKQPRKQMGYPQKMDTDMDGDCGY